MHVLYLFLIVIWVDSYEHKNVSKGPFTEVIDIEQNWTMHVNKC